MNRSSNLLIRTLACLGALGLAGNAVAASPCPPPQISVQGGTSASTVCAAASYSTNFPLNENPISEGGHWTNTISKSFNAPVVTTGGHAIGPGSGGYNDSIAMLTGTYGRDQSITATAYRGGPSGPAEIELHLRMTMVPGTPDEIYTYEVDILPSLAAVVLVKWGGPQGQFTNLASGTLDGVADGDVFTASAIGPANATVFTVTKNGRTILQFTDTAAYATGNPGIGMDAGNPADGANLGWKSYTVTTN